jgi:hypothetical protein
MTLMTLRFAVLLCSLFCAPSACIGDDGSGIHTWLQGDPNCDRILINGRPLKTIMAGGVEIQVSLQDTGAKMRADLVIINHTNARIDLQPEAFRLTVTSPRNKVLKYEDPDHLAKVIDRKARWGAALSAAAGSTARTQTTSQSRTSGTTSMSDNSGNSASGTYEGNTTTTTSQPDLESRRQAAQNVARIRERASANIATIESVALRSNTVMPDQQISGAVFFEHERHHDSVVLNIQVGGELFEIPFTWTPKR